MAHFLIAYLLIHFFLCLFFFFFFLIFLYLCSVFFSARATQMQIFADEAVHLALRTFVIEAKVRWPHCTDIYNVYTYIHISDI